MYLPAVLLTMAGVTGGGSVSWFTDYSAALAQTKAERKPLAVFMGKGGNGWRQLSRGGTPDEETTRLLVDKYICLFIDTENAEVRKLARAFSVQTPVGIVISDATGELMAFHHE